MIEPHCKGYRLCVEMDTTHNISPSYTIVDRHEFSSIHVFLDCYVCNQWIIGFD